MVLSGILTLCDGEPVGERNRKLRTRLLPPFHNYNPPEASIPSEGMMHFPPCFRFPPIFEKNLNFVENVRNVNFSRKISRFSSAKISDDPFLSSTTNFEFPPYFPGFSTFPPCFAKIIISPYFDKFPPCFRKIQLLFTYFMCISFPPYFYHDAFMHYPMHVQ